MITTARHSHSDLSIRHLCAIFGVNRAWLYERPTTPTQAHRDVALRDAIEQIVLAFPGYGYRRVTKALERAGWAVNHTRVLRVMRQESLLCHLKRAFVRTTNSAHAYHTYPNVLVNLELTGGVANWMEMRYTVCLFTCPTCAQTRAHVKDGLTGAGSQRVRCRACTTRYTAQPKPRGYDPALRRQARTLYVDGMNFRRIARHLQVHHQTVINWVNAAADQLPDVPPHPSHVDTVELDELDTCVGTKKNASTSSRP